MPVQTFPFTPGYTHTAVERFAVTVNRFEDTSEQRQLESAQRGLQLIYEWPLVDSCYVSGIQSWFQANIGPGIVFQVLDHRTQTLYLAHHAENVFEVLHGAAQSRQLRLAFTTILSGTTTPAFTAFSRPLLTPCFTLSYTTATTPTLPPDPTAPPSGTIAGIGNSTQFDAGADFHYWYQGSTTQVPAGWTWPARAFGPVGGDDAHWGTVGLIHVGEIFASPFICSRSGAILEAVGAMADRAMELAIGVYAARSGTQLYPGSRVAQTSMSATANVMTTKTFSCQLVEGVLYFSAIQVTSNDGNLLGQTAQQGRTWIGVESTAGDQPMAWEVTGAATLPATFPDSGFGVLTPPVGLVRIR